MTASVLVGLDTHPPVIDADPAGSVQPPDPLVVGVTLSEPGIVVARFRDAAGTTRAMSSTEVTPTRWVVHVDSPDLAGGPGTLSIDAWDDVLNRATSAQAVYVLRPRVYDIRSWEEGEHDVMLRMEVRYEVEASHSGRYDVATAQEGAFEAEAETLPALVVRTRQAEGG